MAAGIQQCGSSLQMFPSLSPPPFVLLHRLTSMHIIVQYVWPCVQSIPYKFKGKIYLSKLLRGFTLHLWYNQNNVIFCNYIVDPRVAHSLGRLQGGSLKSQGHPPALVPPLPLPPVLTLIPPQLLVRGRILVPGEMQMTEDRQDLKVLALNVTSFKDLEFLFVFVQ